MVVLIFAKGCIVKGIKLSSSSLYKDIIDKWDNKLHVSKPEIQSLHCRVFSYATNLNRYIQKHHSDGILSLVEKIYFAVSSDQSKYNPAAKGISAI